MQRSALAARLLVLFALAVPAGLAGCAATVAERGHLPAATKMAQIQPGSTTREDVVKLLGSPSSTSIFDDKRWYYISKKTKQFSFFDPRVLDQQVYAIDFDDKGIVKNVEHKNLKDARNVVPAPGATPAPGRELSFLEQVLGNMGKFNGVGRDNTPTAFNDNKKGNTQNGPSPNAAPGDQ
jgi:outer membrane protein assembly factor BamE (lipoprotein component of BamABCDE complex)